MNSYLITPTLLNSFSYYMSEYGKREDFLKTLSRERSEPTPAMQKGIDFEYLISKCDKFGDDIYWPGILASKCQKLKSFKEEDIKNSESAIKFHLKNLKYFQIIEKISKIVKGGVWQAKVQKLLKIGDTEYIIYGKSDNIKEDWIYDIKFTSSYEVGKFSKSIQHPIYMYCTGLTKFAYLISDGKEWWREDYQASKDIESDIKSRITEFRDYLAGDKEAENLFLTKWKSQ